MTPVVQQSLAWAAGTAFFLPAPSVWTLDAGVDICPGLTLVVAPARRPTLVEIGN